MRIYISLVVFLCVSYASAQDSTVSIFRKPDFTGEVRLDIGVNHWSETPSAFGRDLWRSKSLGIFYTRFLGEGNFFRFNYALGLVYDKVSLGNDTSSIVTSAGETLIGNVSYDDFIKNKLGSVFAEGHFEVRYHPTKTVENSGVFVGVGVVLGARLKSFVKHKYTDSGDKNISKVIAKHSLQGYRAGFQVRLGFKSVHLFYKHYLTSYFKKKIGNADPALQTFGIAISGF